MKITQAEARRLKKRVDELEALIAKQRNGWTHDYPGGTHIASESGVTISTATAIKTARKLGHAVVAVQQSESSVYFYALPLEGSRA